MSWLRNSFRMAHFLKVFHELISILPNFWKFFLCLYLFTAYFKLASGHPLAAPWSTFGFEAFRKGNMTRVTQVLLHIWCYISSQVACYLWFWIKNRVVWFQETFFYSSLFRKILWNVKRTLHCIKYKLVSWFEKFSQDGTFSKSFWWPTFKIAKVFNFGQFFLCP